MLRIQAAGSLISPFDHHGGSWQFVLPAGHDTVRLLSRSASACLQRPWIEHRRQLGVMVKRISVYHGAYSTDISLQDPNLTDGWWAVERDKAAVWRWTDGDAVLPIAGLATRGDRVLLEVVVGQTVPYPLTQPPPETPCIAA